MQKERATREPPPPDRSLYPQPGTAALKRTHAALSGQLSPLQLKMVQYPFGCEVSQSLSPRGEQSVERTHLSPMDGVHAASPRRASERSCSEDKEDKRANKCWPAF